MSKYDNIIYPVFDGAVEMLPLAEDLFTGEIADFQGTKLRNYLVYKAIAERENYYQENTPPAFGDPKYARLDGYMFGLVQGYGLHFTEDSNYIRIFKPKRKRKDTFIELYTLIMTIRKPKKPESYYKDKTEIKDAWNSLV